MKISSSMYFAIRLRYDASKWFFFQTVCQFTNFSHFWDRNHFILHVRIDQSCYFPCNFPFVCVRRCLYTWNADYQQSDYFWGKVHLDIGRLFLDKVHLDWNRSKVTRVHRAIFERSKAKSMRFWFFRFSLEWNVYLSSDIEDELLFSDSKFRSLRAKHLFWLFSDESFG